MTRIPKKIVQYQQDAVAPKKKIKPLKKGDSLVIVGRRWFDRINGNTYFSAVGVINGEEVVYIDYEYGYGDHYKDCIFRELQQAGYAPDVEKYSNGGSETCCRYCDRKGINRYFSVSDVSRKKDL